MKVVNKSSHPKEVSGTRFEPGETKELEVDSVEDLPRRIEEVEKSGDSGSDQNTKESKSESEEDEKGGDN